MNIDQTNERQDRCCLCLNDEDKISTKKDNQARWITSNPDHFVTRCGHGIHKKCLVTLYNSNQTNCPICRSSNWLESDELPLEVKIRKIIRLVQEYNILSFDVAALAVSSSLRNVHYPAIHVLCQMLNTLAYSGIAGSVIGYGLKTFSCSGLARSLFQALPKDGSCVGTLSGLIWALIELNKFLRLGGAVQELSVLEMLFINEALTRMLQLDNKARAYALAATIGSYALRCDLTVQIGIAMTIIFKVREMQLL